MHRRVAVVTGSRAEFGLLTPVMRAIASHEALQLATVAAGMHWVDQTWRDIETAGFTIDAAVQMQLRGVTGRNADAAALGRGVSGFAQVLDELRPDVVLVLGDRIEAFAAASAASVGGLFVGHIHGGDRAEGVADEAMRHAITKLSHLHFPATPGSETRIIHMGEDPACVHRVGSPAVDGLDAIEPDADAPAVIVMMHPVGDESQVEQQRMAAVLEATREHRRAVFMPNSDPGRAGIVDAIEAERDAADVEVIDHLPRERFLAMLRGARAIVGNSSAGLIEAAALGVACVNVGTRQRGRERAANVIDVEHAEVATLRRAVDEAMDSDCKGLTHPYGDGGAGPRIAAVLAQVEWERLSVRKCCVY